MFFNAFSTRFLENLPGRADERPRQNLLSSLDKRRVSNSVYGTFPWLFTESSEATRGAIDVCFRSVVWDLYIFYVLICEPIIAMYQVFY